MKALEYHYLNNFMHVVNGTEFLDALSSGSGGHSLPSMWGTFKPQSQLVDTCERP
jgi:hypothetical protein